ncbi:hypothetical protein CHINAEXTREME_12035 [Halobiforma lacisalsi AJ5]|uniref:Halobacterial output domain-containing protein n=1 Tax=Natronobacterium lacisalsi AJ5 TaxID=358396 RepID=M0LHY2_NATLA|nr:HalOD1 output domain-containing protein [Halobiforma lacisalsi]APW98462.1 hypothetical protein CHINAEXTREME_12035 [Halobiforma lacisalsi AJ5]EMA33237.1 hypothetical protein C445_09323 [Halobiforma lacisalsi AJ5]
MSDNDIVGEVIEAIAQSDNMDASEVDFILADYIDPVVLEKLENMDDGIWEFTFRVSDHQVRLTHGGTIFIDGMKYKACSGKQK